MAAHKREFQWNPDGSAWVIVDGRKTWIGPGALSPGQTVTVAGVPITIPAKPVQPPTVAPYLNPDQMRQVIDQESSWKQQIDDASLALKQAGIQLNEIDLPGISTRAGKQEQVSLEEMAGRGLSRSGISDLALNDVERSRVLSETAARAAFQAIQDKHDATIQRIEGLGGEKERLANWQSLAAASNAAQDNAAIPAPAYPTVALKRPAAAPAATPAPGAPGAPGAAPAVKAPVAPMQAGRSIIVTPNTSVYTPGGRPIGLGKGTAHGWTISATPSGRTKYTRRDIPQVKKRSSY